MSRVYEGSAAAEAKIKENDVIIKISGVPVNTSAELQEQVAKYRPGDKISVTYLRDGKENTVPVTLKNIAGNTSVVTRGMSGVEVFGARLEALSASERRAYNLDSGVKIVDLNDGLFRDLGLRKGTIITNINGKKVTNSADVRSATDNNERSLKTIEGYSPEGRYFSYKFGN